MGVTIPDTVTITPKDATAYVDRQFAARALAFVLDLLVFYGLFLVTGLCAGLFLLIVFAVVGQDFRVPEVSGFLNFLQGLEFVTLYFLYFLLCEWLFGATPGKAVLRMRVVSLQGQRCSFRAALVRGLYRWCDAQFFAIPALTRMTWPFCQRIGDRMARTVIIASRDVRPGARRSGWWLVLAVCVYGCLSVAGISLWWLVLTALRGGLGS